MATNITLFSDCRKFPTESNLTGEHHLEIWQHKKGYNNTKKEGEEKNI
jgi:hypothetical protein